MRTLVLYRGCPGCGKSTHIHNCGLDQYKLSADDIRLQISSPELNINGEFGISQSHDKYVWKRLFEMLEERMKNGCFTVIDATNSKTSEMKRYKDLCDQYRYRIILVDMTDVSPQVCKERNHLRDEFKRVPDEVIDRMYARFATQQVPSGIKVIKPDQLLETIQFKPIDLSHYNEVHICGDIHSCYESLNEYIKEFYCPDDFFIFTGDYLDRGTKHADTFKLLYSLSKKDNVLFLQGNHDSMIDEYGRDTGVYKKEFQLYTMPDLINNNVSKKDARIFFRKLAQCAYFTFDNDTFFCCHGGISSLPQNPMLIPTSQLIRGVGRYENWYDVAVSWENNNPNIYQIHGHRNLYEDVYNRFQRVINLEGRVEFGGKLRTLHLTHYGVHYKEFHNPTPVSSHLLQTEEKHFIAKLKAPEYFTDDQTEIFNLVNDMRLNKHIDEKKFGNISSFNFSREAFQKGIWDNMTAKARGLYINTDTYEILARGYEKFWRIDEEQVGGIDGALNKVKYPCKVYAKENGYLGLISYNNETNNLFYTTKSNPEAPYAVRLKEIFEAITTVGARVELCKYLKENNVTLAVEVVDPVNDPHIIEYLHPDIFALDLIKNTIEFTTMQFNDLCRVSDTIGIKHKDLVVTVDNEDDLTNLIKLVQEKFDNIEGVVIVDNNNWHFKVKSNFYSLWKKMRGLSQSVIKTGSYKWTGSLTTPEENYYYGWLKTKWKELHDSGRTYDIITLRNMYYKEREEYLDTILGQKGYV